MVKVDGQYQPHVTTTSFKTSHILVVPVRPSTLSEHVASKHAKAGKRRAKPRKRKGTA